MNINVGSRVLKPSLFWRKLSVSLTPGTSPQKTHIRTLDTFVKEARVVICGSGLMGNSVAYHLVKNGWKDVVILEQEESIGTGTSMSGPGTLALLKPLSEQQIISKSIELYKELEAQGHNLEYEECGSLYLAQNRERMVLLKRRVSLNQVQGLECKILGPHELETYHPLLSTDDIVGGVYVANDAVANQKLVNTTLAKLAEEGGAIYMKKCRFEHLVVDNGKVAGVDTSRGLIHCQFFVNCGGMSAWGIGGASNPKVKVPTHPAEHYFLQTQPLHMKLNDSLPTIRDYDSHIYIRKLPDNRFLLGGFEELAKPIFSLGVPDNWRQNIPVDWDHFAPILDRCLRRVPELKHCKLDALVNAPDNFSADGKWLLGEVPEIDNYFVGAGLNGNSLQAAGGLGQALAAWIILGESETPLLEFDIKRFVDVHNNRRFLYERVKETVGRQYAINFPLQSEYNYGRRIRCSPLYDNLRQQGAVFGSRMCFERPLYFDKDYKMGDPPPVMPPGTYWRPLFYDSIKEEYQSCKDGVAIIDMSSFSKFQINSACDEALEFLQRTCSNDVNMNSITFTGMHNERGGYENDCMIVRQAHNSFFMVCPTKQQTRIADWMKRHLPSDNSVTLTDVTSMYTVLLLIGPKSKELIATLTDADLNMGPSSYIITSIGYASDVMVMNVTNSGELGYSLYIPSEFAVHVYDELMRAGKDYGVRNAGYLTYRILRIERFIPFYLEEIDSLTTPLEIGRQSRVKFEKDYFIGKFALQKQLQNGITKRLVHFTLDEEFDCENDIWPWGQEPIFRNGQYCGITTSSGYSFTLERMVTLGFVTNPERKSGSLLPITNDFIMNKDALYQIDIAGRKFTAHPSVHQPKLPTSPTTFTPTDYQPTLREKAILQAKR